MRRRSFGSRHRSLDIDELHSVDGGHTGWSSHPNPAPPSPIEYLHDSYQQQHLDDDDDDDGGSGTLSMTKDLQRRMLSSPDSNESVGRPPLLAATLRQPRISSDAEEHSTSAPTATLEARPPPAISIPHHAQPELPSLFPQPQNERHRLVVKMMPEYIHARPKQRTRSPTSIVVAPPTSTPYQRRSTTSTHKDDHRPQKASACC